MIFDLKNFNLPVCRLITSNIIRHLSPLFHSFRRSFSHKNVSIKYRNTLNPSAAPLVKCYLRRMRSQPYFISAGRRVRLRPYLTLGAYLFQQKALKENLKYKMFKKLNKSNFCRQSINFRLIDNLEKSYLNKFFKYRKNSLKGHELQGQCHSVAGNIF